MREINWVNTPGYYYAVAYWLASYLIILTAPKRQEQKKRVISMILCGILLVSIMTATHGSSEKLFVPFMVLYFFMMGAAVYHNCAYDLKTAIYFTARAFIIGEFAASLEWQMIFFLVNYFNVPLNYLVDIAFMVAVHGTVFSVMYQLEKKNQDVNRNITINGREFFSALTIAVAVFAVSNLSYVIQQSPFSSQFVSEIFIIRTLVDLGGVAIMYAYHIQLGELKTRFEVHKLQEMLNMQYNNYMMLEKSIAAVNQKYHDLKYQIAVLKQGVGAQEGKSYLEQMEKEIKSYEAQNKTGNKVLDTILTGKSLYCQDNWIELTSVADGKELEFMDPMDISTLFGNILDNAIEGVSRIEQKEKRLIHLAIIRQKGFLRIRAENCYQDELVFENGLPVTTKKDKKYHGFGLKSIQSTVKKYNGSVAISANNGWFELRILIPLAG